MPFSDIHEPDFLETLKANHSSGQEAFTRLVYATADSLFAFISRRLTSPDECRQVLEEVYVDVHKGLAHFEGPWSLSTWIYSLTHQKICERMDLVTHNPNPPDWVMPGNAMGKLIRKASEALPKPLNHAFHLGDVEGLWRDEAASILGIKPEELRAHLQMARRQIVDWVQNKMAQTQVAK